MVLSVSDSTIKIANAALAEIGIREIPDFNASSTAARTMNTSFEDTLEVALTLYPWRFARARRTLVRTNTGPYPPYEGHYQIPADALAIHAVWQGDQKIVWERFEDEVVTFITAAETDEVTAEVTVSATPEKWPGYFRKAFIVFLAASVCMSLTKDEKLTMVLEQKAQRLMRVGQSRDAQGGTPKRLDTKMFIRKRRAGLGV